MEWFMPPTISSDSSIEIALGSCIAAPSLDEIQPVLEEWRHVLFSESALVVLCLTIARERIRDDAQPVEDLLEYLHLLEDARVHGISQAIERLASSAEPYTIPPLRTIELLNDALAEIEQTTYPYLCAELYSLRADSYMNLWQEEQQVEHLEQTIHNYTLALNVFVADTMPEGYIRNHVNRGLAYLEHLQGEQAEQHIEEAIADFDCALHVINPEEQAHDWAGVHMLRGLTYIDRGKGERDDNLEQALADFNIALTFFTPEDFPQEWASLHMNRGYAYLYITRLEQAEKLESAIADFDAAMSVFTQQEAPQEWATLLKNRASSYANRVQGDCQQNLSQAVADYQACLSVHTLATAPEEYREIQLTLAQLYLQLQEPEKSRQAHEELLKAVQQYAELAHPMAGNATGQAGDDENDTEAATAAIKTLLATKNWSEILDILKYHQRLLLSQQAITLLAGQVADAEKTSSDGYSEFLRMYLQLLENARIQGIESAWQRFTADYLEAVHTIQAVQLAHSFEDLSREIASAQEKFLTTPMLALMYSTLEQYRASKNFFVIPHLERALHSLMSVKLGKLVIEEQPAMQKGTADDGRVTENGEKVAGELLQQQIQDKNWVRQEIHQAGFSFPEGIERDFAYNDPYMMLFMQDIAKLNNEQVAAMMPFLAQMNTVLKSPELTGMTDASSRLMEVIKREHTPYLWAMLRYSRATGYMNQPQKDSQQTINDCNDALLVFTHDITPQMWAHTLLIRASAIMQPFANEQSNYTNEEKQQRDLEQALADFNAALTFFTREKMPLHWALTIGTRGFAYVERARVTGANTENIEQALADFDAALHILNREGTPTQRAMMYMYRAMMYSRLLTGERKKNIEQVLADCTTALSVFPSRMSQEESELQASVFMVRGLAYLDRSEGERKQNIELSLLDCESALTIFTRERSPQEWGRAIMNRGMVYMSRLAGDRRQNFEKAIADYDSALTIFTQQETPLVWTRALTNRGICYMDRVAGDRGKNQEQALADFNAALLVFHEGFKGFDRGLVLSNRGSLYLLRIAGERKQNFLLARDDFDKALTYFSSTQTPQYWAKTLLNRGMANRSLALSMGFAWRGSGFRAIASQFFSQGQIAMPPLFTESEQLFEQSLADINAALTVFSQESTPQEWAMARRERAQTHAYRLTGHLTGNREQSIQQAIDDFSAALTVFSRDNIPTEWAIIRTNRAVLYQQLVEENHLDKADLALADIEAAMTVLTREVAPAKYRCLLDIRARVFECLQQWEDAHAALFTARDVQRDLVATASGATRSDIIAEFALIDTYVRDVRAMLRLDHPDLEAVAVALEEGRAQALRAALDLDTIMLEHISSQETQQRAKRFLIARNQWRKCQHEMLEPTTSLDASLQAIRSHDLQTAYIAFLEAREAIRAYDNPDFMTPVPTLASIAHALHVPGEALIYLVAESLLNETRGMAVIVTRDAENAPRVIHVSLPELKEAQILDLLELEENTYPKIRAQQAIEQLGSLGLDRLARELYARGIRKATLVTYGWLSLFPLSASLVTHTDGAKRPLGEIFEVTFAPSARAAALAYEHSRHTRRQRPLLLIAGNPRPLPANFPNLPFAAAEADTTQRIARKYGYPPAHIRYLKSREATRENVVTSLQQAWYAHLAVHGKYRADDPPRSHLLLAGTGAIPEKQRNICLQEALDGSINLSGLRLLVLSACETAIIDTNRIPDEMVGLAAGFLQAGVVGVIASLWPVEDHATYLLMSRFAQLYLDPQGIWSPARALAEAQRWLREEATYRVLAKYDPSLPDNFTASLKAEATSPESVGAPANQERETTSSGQRSLHTEQEKAMEEIHHDAALRARETPDELPYKDAKYWAAFMVTGY
jgi:CHAT domain-containing protein